MQNYKNLQVDLTNCDKEPIHFIGRIQPHGFLLIIENNTFIIEQVSQNINKYLTVNAAEDLLGKPLQVLFLDNKLPFDPKTLLDPEQVNPNIIFFGENKFFAFSHTTRGKLILECEPYAAYPDQEQIKQNQLLSQLHKDLNTLQTIESLGQKVAEVFRQVLDYDRVDIMQFDIDWHTEVIAESIKENVNPFLGHHFPASDIPEPARASLLKKTIRQIPDVNAKAVEIIPYINPSTGSPSNIIKAELRNPSEIHLEYLRNMGVAATISYSIIVKGKLWGIITAHNNQPAFINFWKRQLCELITQTFADIIAGVQEKRNLAQYEEFKSNEQAFINDLSKAQDLISGLSQTKQNVLKCTESMGAALVLNKEIFTFGITPNDPQIINITNWLGYFIEEKVYRTRELSKVCPEAACCTEIASGLLALEISRYNQEYLLFFKPEIKENRTWAGNPEKPVLSDDMQIHPRKSFEKWTEVVKGKSHTWSINEIEIAQILVKDLIALRLRDQARKLEALNSKLETTANLLSIKNTQLKDLALIMSHNLRSPLNNIEGLNRMYKEDPDETNATFVMDRIQEVSDNMKQTISDLDIIINAELNEELLAEEVNLAEVIKKEAQNLGAIIEESAAMLKTDLQVPTLLIPKLYLESILHNLISNALKYRAPERQPMVVIKTWDDINQFHLSVTDNGLGMNLEKVGHKIFGLYKTFHQHKQAKGLGLYLIKMQVESLGGKISVESEVNKGTTFTVSLSKAKK